MGISGTTVMSSAQVALTQTNSATFTANDYITFTEGTITWEGGKNKVSSPNGDYFVKDVTLTDTNNSYTVTQTDLATISTYGTATFTEGTFAVTNATDKYFSGTNANV